MPESLKPTIRENAAAPAEASVDGQTVRQHPLRDQIEADRYLSADAGYRAGDLWINETADETYVCVDAGSGGGDGPERVSRVEKSERP